MINTAGGITGGDHFHVKAEAEAGTRLTITSQTAERAYRAQPGQTGTLQSRVTIGAGANVAWLPQETILFQGCSLRRSLHIDMKDRASFLMVEPLVFGRLAMGESLTDAFFMDRIELRRNGRLAYLDVIRLQGNITDQLAQPYSGAGAGAMANLIYLAPDAGAQLSPIRAMLPDSGGASLVDNDLLVLRLVAPDGYLLRKSLIPILNLLTQNNLPRCWIL